MSPSVPTVHGSVKFVEDCNRQKGFRTPRNWGFLKKKMFTFNFMFRSVVSMCLHVWWLQRPQERIIWSYRWLGVTLWVVGTETVSSAEAARALTHRVNSRIPHLSSGDGASHWTKSSLTEPNWLVIEPQKSLLHLLPRITIPIYAMTFGPQSGFRSCLGGKHLSDGTTP